MNKVTYSIEAISFYESIDSLYEEIVYERIIGQMMLHFLHKEE